MEKQLCKLCKESLESHLFVGEYHMICRPCQVCGHDVIKGRMFRIQSDGSGSGRPWDCPCLERLDYDFRVRITTEFAFEMLRIIELGESQEPYDFFMHGLFIDFPKFEKKLRDEIEHYDDEDHCDYACRSKVRLEDFEIFLKNLLDPIIKGSDE